MNRKFLVTTVCALGAAAMLGACTNPVSTAGTTSTLMEGTVTEMEYIDIDSNKYNSDTNTLLGAAAGALIGNLIGDSTTGTLIGAGVGGLAGNLGSQAANRGNGVRLTVETEDGTLVVDQPFSCLYHVGAKVRLISNSTQGSVQVYSNGHYVTATEDSKSSCPTVTSN